MDLKKFRSKFFRDEIKNKTKIGIKLNSNALAVHPFDWGNVMSDFQKVVGNLILRWIVTDFFIYNAHLASQSGNDEMIESRISTG